MGPSTSDRSGPCPVFDRVTRHGPLVEVVGDGPLLARVGAHLVAVDRPASDLAVHRPTLEDRFITLTAEQHDGGSR